MFDEDQLLPLSALQHLRFCERQCALIHIEGLWAENRLTVEGRHLHEKTHQPGSETSGRIRVARGLALRSLRLGLVGKADVVEFQPRPGIAPPGQPFPVEYKRGGPKRHDADRVQLCGEALCLEEMFGVPVTAGALFYGRRRRRLNVSFDSALRKETEQAAARLHELIASRRTPVARREAKCESCSLLDLCLPGAVGSGHGAQHYVDRALARSLASVDGPAEDL